MPTLTAATHQNLLSILQSNLNGNTSVLVPSGQAFYVPGTSVPLTLKYDGYVTKRGTLSAPSPANGATLTLGAFTEAAQFRAGDVCYLVGNSFAGAVGAADNTADQVTVTSVSGQDVTVTGRAGGAYAVGSSLVVVDDSQPGGYAGGTSDGGPVGNQALGELLAGLEELCNSTGTADGGGHTATTIDIDNAGGWDEAGSIEGATVTMLTATAANNVGVTAVVVSATVADPSVLTLTDFKDSDGNALTQWPTVPSDADTVSIELDLSDGKLTDLREAGGDMTTMISAMLTMHRKLDESLDSPEIPLVNEWQVWGQKTGSLIRSSLPYNNAGPDLTITVQMDGAVGDIPFPLSGMVRVIDADDGVGSSAWDSAASASNFVAYTRAKRSNVLDFGAGFAGLGANYGTGCLVELQGTVNGFATNRGFAPEAANKYLSGLLYQLVNAVNAFAILGA